MLTTNFEFISYKDLLEGVRLGLSEVPLDVDHVVGIPRSGMIPAYMVGLHLNLPVSDLASFIENRQVGNGKTRSVKSPALAPMDSRRILLVDDSYYSGEAMRSAVEKIKDAGFKGQIVTCAAIVTPTCKGDVDLHFIKADVPRIFEWNVFHHAIMNESCLDFDGVLCVDPTDEENDDGERYKAFLLNAKPLYIPTQEIAYIVSARLEKYRPETEAWLKKYGVKYKQLRLLNAASKEERMRTQSHSAHKIKTYKETGAKLFVESSLQQASDIARETGKPVLCTEIMQVVKGQGVHADLLPELMKQKAGKFRYFVRMRIVEKLPAPVKERVKKIVRRLRPRKK